VLCPDDHPSTPVGFVSIERLREFIADMQPREIAYSCATPDERETLQALVERCGAASVH
jgi:hypothetical protein